MIEPEKSTKILQWSGENSIFQFDMFKACWADGRNEKMLSE